MQSKAFLLAFPFAATKDSVGQDWRSERSRCVNYSKAFAQGAEIQTVNGRPHDVSLDLPLKGQRQVWPINLTLSQMDSYRTQRHTAGPSRGATEAMKTKSGQVFAASREHQPSHGRVHEASIGD